MDDSNRKDRLGRESLEEGNGLKVSPFWNTFTGEMSKCFNELGILQEYQSGTIALIETD
jgi:hypothetical protein